MMMPKKISNHWVACLALCPLFIASVSYATPLSIVDSPLFLTNLTAPNTLINLSIEWPMEGAAYNDQNDTASGGNCTGRPANESGANIGTCYIKTNTYLGYFNPNKCYNYVTANARFEVLGNVINYNSPTLNYHECNLKYSGNFLNWATMTAIDEFRRVMTGGHRSTDTAATASAPSLTVLQRANMDRPKGDSTFPLKKIGAAISPGKIAAKTVTPFDVAVLYVYNHGTQIDIGTTVDANNKATNLNVRVKVCDTTGEANCQTYTGTNRKPVGLVQKNADNMRFAVTSYLLDNSQTRDGGVLRSKMKFAGPNKFDAGVKSANSNSEWNATTGQFLVNPDAADATASGVTNSGVINYINKFGVNGYKSYDPAGELFYEAIRYFKGLPPTPEYSSGLTATMKDGFPVITSWDDPIQYSCQTNFIIGINDANPWLDKKLPGTAFKNSSLTNGTALIGNDYGEPGGADSSINVKNLTNTVGQLEGLNGTSRCVGGNTSTFNTSATNKTISGLGEMLGTCPGPGKQNSYYIAGLAYYANTQDIRPDRDGKQTIVTYMIDTQEYSTSPLLGNMNMLWLAGKYGGFIDSDEDSAPNLAKEWDTNNDDEPNNYVLASKPERLIEGLNNAFKNILVRTNNASTSLAANSGSLQTDTTIYQAQFDSSDWSGHIYNFTLNNDGRVVDRNDDGKLDSADDNWDAGELIPTAAARNIFTIKSGAGVSFDWANLSVAQQTALKTNSIGVLGTDVEGQDRLNWLRGDSTKEERNPDGLYRNRVVNVLGDIVNSDPIYTKNEDYGYKALPTSASEKTTYASYVLGKSSRIPMLYAGANDGMLHAFRADLGNVNSGKEMFAYVPGAVFNNLSRLTEPNYVHTYYVDGAPTVGDAYWSGAWRTILVSGLNKGGKAVYALDISNPTAFAATNVLWEYTGSTSDTGATGTTDINALGLTYSRPQIARLNDGSWAAIFGNGYNSISEKAFLYIVNLKTGALIKKIPTNSSTSNGLSSPVLYDSNGDYMVDYVYAGDLQGNLWKFDLSATSSGSWGLANGGNPLFTARNDANQVQPITSQPVIGGHADGGAIIYVGTGSYLSAGDIATADVQSFYAIWDKPATSGTVPRTALVKQTITSQIAKGTQKTNPDGTTTIFDFDLRTTSSNPVDYAVGKRGWYLDFTPPSGVANGERIISQAIIFDDRVMFLTTIPSPDSCNPGGDSWLMQLDLNSGSAYAGSTFDVNNDDKFDDKDKPGANSASGIKSNVGMGKGVVTVDTNKPNITVVEINGVTGNIMSPNVYNKKLNNPPPCASCASNKVQMRFWQQLQ